MVPQIYLNKNAYGYVAKDINQTNKLSIGKFTSLFADKSSKNFADSTFFAPWCREVETFH